MRKKCKSVLGHPESGGLEVQMEKYVLLTASVYRHIKNFHLPYINAFQEKGWIVHIACADAPERIPGAERVFSLPFTKRMAAPQNFIAVRKLRGLIRRYRYDLIVTHTSLAAFFTRLAVKGMGGRPRVVNMVHGYLFDERTPALKRAVLTGAERFTAPETDVILTMNQWDYETARAMCLGREIYSVPGIGVDFSRLDDVTPAQGWTLRQELGIPLDAFILIYGAEFSARKDQGTLLRAMALLPSCAYLLLPGDGRLLDACKALARELGVEGRVCFPGQIVDMAPWYSAANAAVSSSRSEGLPFNIMEAMYLRLPVVASRVKGHVDLLYEGESGLLFAPGDEHACARQIMRLVKDPALGQALGLRGCENAEQYALEHVLPKVMAYYEGEKPVTVSLAAAPVKR